MEVTWVYENRGAGRRQERLSRRVATYRGPGLRGLSFREYQLFQRFNVKDILRQARILMGQELWTKLDRCRPVSRQQYQRIGQFVRQAAVSRVSDYPYHYPQVRFGLQSTSAPGGRKGIVLKSVALKSLEKIVSDLGQVYFFPGADEPIDIDGRSGRVGFATHAIERFQERLSELAEYYASEPSLLLWLVAHIVQDRDIRIGHRPMLSFVIPHDGTREAVGHFSLEYVDGYWLATSFVLPGMRGTPEEVRRGLDALAEKYGSDRYQREAS